MIQISLEAAKALLDVAQGGVRSDKYLEALRELRVQLGKLR